MTTEEGMELLLTLDALLDETPGKATEGQRMLFEELDRLFWQRKPPFTQPELDRWNAPHIAAFMRSLGIE